MTRRLIVGLLVLALARPASVLAQTTTTRTDRLVASTSVVIGGTSFTTSAATLGGTLAVTGATTLNGAVTLGDAAGDALTFTGRVSSSILWTTDTAVDLGASGANRARDFFLGRNAAIGGTLGVTGASTLAALSATTGSFSSTLGVTGASTLAALSATTGSFSSTLGVTGPATLSGGGTVVSGQSLATSYSPGWGGSGYHLGYNTSYASQSFLELDRLNVRGIFSVYELLVHQIRATNGSIFVANTGKAKTVTGTGPYTIDTEDVHGFAVNDLIRAQRFTGTGTYQSDMTVTSVPNTKQFVATLRATYTPPAAGMDFVRLGNTSAVDRQGSIYLTADDTNAPYINVLDGVASFTDWGSSGKVRVRLGNLNGACGYAANAYGFCAGDYGANAVTVDPTNGIRFIDNGTVRGVLTGNYWQIGASSGANIAMNPTSLTMYDGAANPRLTMNTTELVLFGGVAGANPKIRLDATNGIRFLNGSGTVTGQWLGSTITLGDTSTEHLSLTSTALEFKDGATVLGSMSGGALTLGQPLTTNNTGQMLIDGDSIDFRWRDNVGATSTIFTIANSSGAGYATLTGNLDIVGSGNKLRTNLVQNQSGSTLTLKALSGTTPEIIIDTSAIGALRPLTSGVGGLGSATYKWGDIYFSEPTTTAAAYPLVSYFGRIMAKSNGVHGTFNPTTCTSMTFEYGVLTAKAGC